MKLKLTPEVVATAAPDPKTRSSKAWVTDYLDAEAPGLRLRVYARPDGSVTRRVWAVLASVRGTRRLATIGDVESLTLTQARQKAEAIRSEAKLGRAPVQGRTAKLSSIVAAFESTPHFASLAPLTQRHYSASLKRAVDLLGDPPVSSLTRAELQKSFNGLHATAPSSALKALDVLKTLLLYAVDEGIVEASAATRVSLPRGTPRGRILSDGELAVLLRAFRRRGEKSLAPLGFLLQLYTLARPGEVFGLTFGEIEREEVGLSPGLWWTLPAERAKSRRAIRRPLSEGAADVMRQVVEMHDGHSPWTPAFRWRGKYQPGSGEYAGPFKKIAREVGFEDADIPRPHDLRRTSRSLLSRLGVRVEVAESLLGHALPTLLGTYDLHAWEVEKRAAVEALAAELGRIEKLGEVFD